MRKNLWVMLYLSYNDNVYTLVGIGQLTLSLFKMRQPCYNISVGDVFFVINCLEKDYLGEDAEKMLFFIKSFYSMRLYEDYDIITENKGQIYPSDDNVRGIYRSDDRFLHTNVLQRLVNGSYFTYSPGELIAYNPSNDAPIDQRTILGFRFNKYDIDNNTGLNKLIKEVKDTWKKFDTIDEEKKKEVISKLRLVEFFFLSITHSISSRTRAELGKASYIEKYQCQCRANVLPVAFSEFNGLTGYYVFDVLAPFANIINPEYCYCRFQYGREIFEIACSCEKSLLYSLVVQARIGRGEDKEKVSNEIHKKLQVITDDISPKEVFYSLSHHLQSDAIIRNAEILAAFFEDCKLARNKRSKNQASGGSGIIKILESFYKSLIYPEDRAMSTHSRSKAEDGKPHKIRFGFLNSFVELLDQIDKKDSVLMNCFHEIFNPSFGLTDFEKKLRLFYLMSIPDDKGKKYSANNLVKIIASKYPKLESNLQDIFSNESSRTSKTPSDWYSYLLKNKAIDNVLDNSVFNVISSNISSEIITKSLESILSSTQSDSKEE